MSTTVSGRYTDTSMTVLGRLQRDVSRGELAREERDALVRSLWERGMPQVEIARALSRAAKNVGGPPISRNAVQKICARSTNGDIHDQ